MKLIPFRIGAGVLLRLGGLQIRFLIPFLLDLTERLNLSVSWPINLAAVKWTTAHFNDALILST